MRRRVQELGWFLQPKPFIILGDKQIIWHTINVFLKLDNVIQIIIPTSKEWFGEVEVVVNHSKSDVQLT